MNLDKLKESARKYEQSGQWRPAIDVYKKALREFEESGEGVPDPSLYNRIGDLEMKDGESGAAVRAYEQAADLYTEQGFFNNAIALCGKILRISPNRSATYLRLAQLNARKNFVGEARKNLVQYLERMDALHHREEALAALRAFADQFWGNPEIRVMMIELLRTTPLGAESREQLGKLAEELEARVDLGGRRTRERLAALEGEAGRPPPSGGADLVFIDVGIPDPRTSAGSDAALADLDLEAEPEAEDAWRRDPDAVTGMDLVGGDLDLAAAGEAQPLDIDAFPAIEGERAVDGMPLVDDRLDPRARSDRTPLAETYETLDEATRAEPAAESELVFLPVSEPAISDELTLARERARLLLEVGDRAAGLAALDELLERLETASRYDEALGVAIELTRLEPNAVYRFQKRVELAYRSGRRDAMLEAYLDLAEALLRSGGREHALTVYRRILEHDPDNEPARSAIASLTAPVRPPPAPQVPRESFVDLGSLILDEPQIRDTRIRVDQQAPIEDEDQAFLEALSQFKRGIEENLDAEDYQAHYDLGIAFKEMGLLDEAIAQFQKALRAPEGRLKTSEQLGIAFFEKTRYAIAEAVLRRAIESLPGGDEEKIGLIYWLARAVEAQRRYDEAIRFYERALAVDIRFLDVSERVHRLSTEPR